MLLAAGYRLNALSLVQEQERLLAAYGSANKEAAQRIKRLEGQLKAKDDELAQQRQALERDVARALESQQHTSADTAQKLRCAWSKPRAAGVVWCVPCLVHSAEGPSS